MEEKVIAFAQNTRDEVRYQNGDGQIVGALLWERIERGAIRPEGGRMIYNPSDYNSKLADKSQTEYVKKNNYPDFAPPFGRCWSCKKNIYEPVAWDDYWDEVSLDSPEATKITGITVKEAGETLVTGCPHCHISYCD